MFTEKQLVQVQENAKASQTKSQTAPITPLMAEQPRYGRPVLCAEPLTNEQVIQRQEQERQAVIDRQFKAVIPPLFHGARLDDLSDKLREAVINKPYRQGLLIWGPPGTGKTHTLSAMAYNAIANGTGVQRKTFKDILLSVRGTYDGSGTEQKVFEKLLNPSVLIIEDVAVGKQSEFTTDTLLRVLDSRLEHCKPTWLTSNLSPENLEAMFDERVGKLEVERKPVRRPLTEEEVPLLLRASTASTETRFGMSGYERAVLYLLALETGLRATELKNLTVSCFDLENNIITLEKTKTKNRKEAVLPIKQCRVEPLKAFLRGKGPDDAVFNVWENPRSAEMIRADLKESEIKTENGLPIKFHSLRDTFITSLDKTSASLAERMTLARHSMAGSLTLGIYTHVKAFNLKKVVEELPAYEWPGTSETRQLKAV